MTSFIRCELCGKTLIERLPNGLWRFRFGKREGSLPVVDMEIYGSIKMSCMRRSCKHINVLNYFPSIEDNSENKNFGGSQLPKEQSRNGMGI